MVATVSFTLDYLSPLSLVHLLRAAEIERNDYATAPEVSVEDHEAMSARVNLIRERLRDVEPGLNHLIRLYQEWQKENGLTLGSATEHIFDTTLTLAQRQWLAHFSRRWEIMEQNFSQQYEATG